jgi:Ca2+-binding RTX toxin-like protein
MAIIRGTNAADTLGEYPGVENDTIYGYGGDDRLDGWYGNDTLYGGTGDDALFGGSDNDVTHGGAGNDYLSDNEGTNRMLGGAGNDRVDGNGYMSGGAGNDVLFSWSITPVPTEMKGGTGADEFHHFFSPIYGDQHIAIDDFKPAQGDKLAIGAYGISTGEISPADLFQAFDGNDDGQIRASDHPGGPADLGLAVGANSHGALVLTFDAGDLTLKGVDHINAADWLV